MKKDFRFLIFDFGLKERIRKLREVLPGRGTLRIFKRVKELQAEAAKWKQLAEQTEKHLEKAWERENEYQQMVSRAREREKQWEDAATEQREKVTQLQKEMEKIRLEVIAECDCKNEYADRLHAVYHRRPGIVVKRQDQDRRDLERLMVLAGLDPENDLWKVVLSYADESEQDERQEALKPDLMNETRQYNAGRAACAYDFATALRELWSEAQQSARRLKEKGPKKGI